MKAVMYHYIRQGDFKMPHFIHLNSDNFEKQIDYFIENYTIVSQEQMVNALQTKMPVEKGMVLTFDDGFNDHYEYVYPILKKRNLWGIFYVPTAPFETGKLLDVHRVHYLLGKYGGEIILNEINKHINDEFFINGNKQRFEETTYLLQNNDAASTKVKQIINYMIKPIFRQRLLDSLMTNLCSDEKKLSDKFYMNKTQLREMATNGMSIASHGHSHTLLSNLQFEVQNSDIESSFHILEDIIGKDLFPSFCYPYGGKLAYNNDTLNIINKKNVKFSFSVESRDISIDDLSNSIHELPRYDCNEFKFGKATVGVNNEQS